MTSRWRLRAGWMLGVGALVCVASYASAAEITLGEVLRARGLTIPAPLASLPVGRQSQRTGAEMTFSAWTAEDAHWRVELESDQPSPTSAAEAKIAGRMRSIERLYQSQVTPYPGEITRVQECPTALRPRSRTRPLLGKPGRILLVRATARFTLGACDPQAVPVSGALAWIYRSERRELLEIKVFYRGAKIAEEKLLDALSGIRDLHP